MIYTEPAPGVYKFPTSRWRSVALYSYSKGWWSCESCGYWHPTKMTVKPCIHIQTVKEKR